jgi:hypothetical protein
MLVEGMSSLPTYEVVDMMASTSLSGFLSSPNVLPAPTRLESKASKARER